MWRSAPSQPLQEDLHKGVREQRLSIDLSVDVCLDEVYAAVVPEGAPLHVDADVPDRRVRSLPVRHAGRSLHVAAVGACAEDNTDLEQQDITT